MSVVRVTTSLDLASSRRALWPWITDTDRINRGVGMAPVHPEPIEAESSAAREGARFLVSTRSAGLAIRYDEFPFEWQAERHFRIVRKMREGPFEALRVNFDLAPGPEGEGTRLEVAVAITLRAAVARPLAWAAGRSFLRKLVRLTRAIDAHLSEGSPDPYLEAAVPANTDALANAAALLTKSGIEAARVERLARYVGGAADADVVRIRPFELAARWGDDALETLRAFLHAVPAGLVELRWSIVCPSCRTASREVTALEAIGEGGHCQLCDVTFDLDLDRAVEATFIVHPAIRDVPSQLFCVGGPARTPHVLAQACVPDGSATEIPAPEAPGRYRLFARGGAWADVTVDAAGAPSARIRLAEGGAEPRAVIVAPEGLLSVANGTGEGRHVKLERREDATRAATAHVVSTLPEFRRLFSRELLKPETPLKVARVAILFSDLTGSTALYSRVGDAAAFRLVDDHFDVLRDAMAAHGGAVVKTMGDAVMAAFVDASLCARAALAALRSFERFRAEREHGAFIGLKLGMFVGPCYVVSANGALDYFGQTVNVASRIQHLAESGELVLDASTFESLPQEALSGMRLVERFEARVKGVDAPLHLVRLHLSASVAPRMPPVHADPA